MSEIIAYASSTRPNHLWSAAQFNSALPKNRADADIPLVAKADLDSLTDIMRNNALRLAVLHQASAAEEAGSVRYCLSRHPAIVVAIADRTIEHQTWAEKYAAYSREQLGISDGDYLYA